MSVRSRSASKGPSKKSGGKSTPPPKSKASGKSAGNGKKPEVAKKRVRRKSPVKAASNAGLSWFKNFTPYKPGKGEEYNMELERSGRVRDFIDFGELLCRDALDRNESCGGHFREEFQTEDGEATRNDEDFAHAAVWEFKGDGETPARHSEDLKFEEVKLAVRSYK